MTDANEDTLFFCQRISTHPLIFFSVPNGESRLGISALVSPLVAHMPAVFLLGLWWTFEDDESVEPIAREYRAWQQRYPLHSFIVLCNTAEQMRLFAKHGVPCVLHNQNIFIDEAVFKPIAGEERKYQALYNAGLTQFKRHNLCTELDSLVLLYGRWHGLLSDENEYPRQVRAMLPKALFVNDSIKPGEYVGLLPHEVAVWYSRARVGLCLSGNEGAMYASMEYLLSGLPIVSTPSRGGRDHFFDAETCLIVEPTPQAVAAGVAAMIARNLSPQFVRERTLEKVWAERRRFLNFLSAIFLDRGVPYPGETFWKSFFINKMIRPVRRSQLPNLVFLGF